MADPVQVVIVVVVLTAVAVAVWLLGRKDRRPTTVASQVLQIPVDVDDMLVIGPPGERHDPGRDAWVRLFPDRVLGVGVAERGDASVVHLTREQVEQLHVWLGAWLRDNR